MTSEEAENLNEDLIDNISESDKSANIDVEKLNEHDAEVRKRIDDLLERKRLKEQLDDSDDW